MKKAIKNINTCLSIYLNPEECEDLHKRMSTTTCRSKSEFARKMLFGKPVRVLVHSESIDSMIEELVCLRKQLAGLVDRGMSKEEEGRGVLQLVMEIKEKINQLADHVCKCSL